MGRTSIEWTDKSWNPVTGCTHAGTPGCDHCYAKRMAKRLAGRYGYPADEPFRATLHPDRLDEPLRWRKPSMIFVCSMGDLFHPDVPVLFVDRVWTEMSLAGKHTFLVLTKRPRRAALVLARIAEHHTSPDGSTWPLRNVWLGTSVENQAAADERIPHLLRTPAAKRFVSCEPLLGVVDLEDWLRPRSGCGGASPHDDCVICAGADRIVDWVIAGGESGPGARPMAPEWARSIRDQCVAADIPFFFKQWGDDQGPGSGLPGHPSFEAGYHPGEKHGGRVFDGREWNQIETEPDD